MHSNHHVRTLGQKHTDALVLTHTVFYERSHAGAREREQVRVRERGGLRDDCHRRCEGFGHGVTREVREALGRIWCRQLAQAVHPLDELQLITRDARWSTCAPWERTGGQRLR